MLININLHFFFPRYISNHLHGLFAGAWDPQTKDPLPVDIPLPISSQGMTHGIHLLSKIYIQIKCHMKYLY